MRAPPVYLMLSESSNNAYIGEASQRFRLVFRNGHKVFLYL